MLNVVNEVISLENIILITFFMTSVYDLLLNCLDSMTSKTFFKYKKLSNNIEII